MKKVTKIVTLAAATMCAFAVVGGSFAIKASADKARAAARAWHNVKYVADSKITVNGPEMARAGDKVSFSLSYRHDKYEVTGVRIGNDRPAELDDNMSEFYFVMPDEEAEVVIESKALGGAESLAYEIVNPNSENGLYLNGAPFTAEAGDIIEFYVGMAPDSPLRFTGTCDLFAMVPKADGSGYNYNHMDFLASAGNYYAFEMPAYDVYVQTGVEGKSYFLTFDDMTFVSKVTYKDKINTVVGKQTAVFNDPEGYFIPFGSEVEVEFRNTYVKQVVGVKLNENQVDFDGTQKIKFTMPGKDVALEILTDIFYRPVTFDDGSLYPASANYTARLFVADSSNGEYTEFDGTTAMYDQYVRAYIAPNDENRVATAYEVRFYTGNTSNTATITKGNDATGEYVQFMIGTGDRYVVAVKTEKVKSFAENHAIIGSYKGANIYNTNATTVNCNTSATVDSWGSYTSAVSFVADGENSPATGDGRVLLNGDPTKYAYYGNGFLINSWTATTGANNTYDLYVYYKASSVKMAYKLNRSYFGAVEAIVDNVVVARCFYTLASGSGIRQFYATGVEFEFTNDATTVGVSTSAFNVKVNGTVIGSVSGSGASAVFVPAA